MKLNWYFDFISPFAYIQLSQMNKLPAEAVVEFKPILFAGLLNHWKNIGPAEIPPKRIFTYQHCYWKAKSLGIPFKMPPAHPFNSLTLLRIVTGLGNNPSVIRAIFDAIWSRGIDPNSEQMAHFLANELNLSNWESLTSDKVVKDRLREATERAAALGVFGVPTFVVDDHQRPAFWGTDAFEMCLDYLADPKGFMDHEMLRLKDLPVGVQRKGV